MNLELYKSKNLLKILNTAIDAGKEIQKVYKKSFNVEIKDDNSPITFVKLLLSFTEFIFIKSLVVSIFDSVINLYAPLFFEA